MGTRSLINVLDEERETICTIYRQFDGYPSGMGADIKDILGPRKLGNGIGSDCNYENFSNGMGEAAIQLAADLKDRKSGNVYLMKPETRDVWEEFVYTVSPAGEGFDLHVATADGAELYSGPLLAFDPDAVEQAA